MWEVREPGTIIQAAERAAEGGNFAAAEHLLREAARLQEAELGPRHPDLANTLNNLGIVCEMTGKPDEAEQYFRRAVSIARTSLPPDHPFVATSQKNLRDFCEARGKQIEAAAAVAPPAPTPAEDSPTSPEDSPTFADDAPAPADEPTPAPEAVLTPTPEVEAEPAVALELEPEPEPVAAPQLEAEPAAQTQAVKTDDSEPVLVTAASAVRVASAEDDRQLPADKLFRRVALGALGPMAMLMVILAVGLPRLGAPELAVPPPAIPLGSPLEPSPETELEPAPVDPIPATKATEPTVAPASHEPADDAGSSEVTPASAPATSAITPANPVVVRATLCGDIDGWACDPADRPVPHGPLFFYTQIKATSATTVQHRWFQNDRLLQTVQLRVQPNRADGYRTYSRNVMTTDSAGKWRIELRGEDGALLHEERFTVH
jgi:hypothetical protein